MAKISTYPIVSIPTLNDLLIGTDVENLNETKNFTIGDIADLIIVGSYVPYVGATADVDLGIHSITASSFIVPGGLATQFVKADGSLDSTVYQVAGDYITELSGEATAVGPGVATVVLSNGAVIGKVLTGLTITGGSVSSTDTILQAFGKVQNQINSLVGGVQYQGTWDAATNTPTLQSGVGVKGYYYVVSVAGSTNLDGITDWNVGDWAIFDGTAWQQVDNTDTVVSVNGKVGVVVLTTTDIAEGTNLYYTDARVRQALSLTTTGNSGASTYNNLTGAFNIPNYTLAGLGGVPLTRELTINGTTYDLSANRSWSVGTVTQINTSGPITGGPITVTGTIGITQSGISTDGYLSSVDWNTFNNKQNALTNPVTGTGTTYYVPMWTGLTTLGDSIISHGTGVVNFNYNNPSGATINYTNIGTTPYTYSIVMNNVTRNTFHTYTDGNVVNYIGGVQVSRMFSNGNFILGDGTIDTTYKLAIEGNLFIETIINAVTDTDRFIVSDGGVIKYRTGAEVASDIGAVTSVGLSMPSAFNVANSPITSSGTLAVTGAGVASQYIRGDGTLADFPTGGGGGGSSVSYYLNGSINQGTFAGNVYYQMDKTPVLGIGTDFSIGADGYISQFITNAGVPDSLLIPAGNWNLEFYFSASSSGGTPSFYVELYKYDGTNFTLIASNSAVPELIAFGTTISPYFSALAVPETILTINDRLAIRIYVNASGRTITLHTENSHLCQIITTFTTGLTALNGLTAQVQYLATGTSGTDFNISSSVATHTFNLPTASAVNRGALSSADWTTFNNKIGGSGALGQVAYFTGTNTQTGNNNLFWDITNGRLGIGTNVPTNPLHVFTAVAGTGILLDSNTAAFLTIRRSGSDRLILSASGAIGTLNGLGNGMAFQTDSVERMRLTSVNGNLHIGTFTSDSGQRLQVMGDALITGITTIGDSSGLYFRFNAGARQMSYLSNGAITSFNIVAGAISAQYSTIAIGTAAFISGNGFSDFFTRTTNYNSFGSAVTFNPTSGTTTFNSFVAAPTINQVGATGITRGLYIVPVLTAAADWRAIEITSGISILAPSTTGSASLRLPNGVAPTTPVNGDVWSTTTDLLARINNTTYSLINSGLSGSGAAGQVTFWNSTTNITSSSSFLWDNTNQILSLFSLTSDSVIIGRQSTIAQYGQQNEIGFGSFVNGSFSDTSAIRAYYTGDGTQRSGKIVLALRNIGGGVRAVNFGEDGQIYSNFATIPNTYPSKLFIAGLGNTASSWTAQFHNSTGASNSLMIDDAGSTILGSNVSTGQRLQVTGDTLLKGSGNTSATTALTVQDSAGANLINVRNDNLITYGTGLTLSQVGSRITFSTIGGANVNQFRFTTTNTLFSPSGNTVFIDYLGNFNPTSGTSSFVGLQFTGTINQTGGANGITRGLYINPTLTAAADWRGLEISAGGAYINTTSVNASAILQADSTTKGFLPPRMTAVQRAAITSPAEGLIIFQIDGVIGLYIYASATWRTLGMI